MPQLAATSSALSRGCKIHPPGMLRCFLGKNPDLWGGLKSRFPHCLRAARDEQNVCCEQLRKRHFTAA